MTSMTLPVLSPVSSLESYVQAVNAIPMLTPERETRARPPPEGERTT